MGRSFMTPTMCKPLHQALLACHHPGEPGASLALTCHVCLGCCERFPFSKAGPPPKFLKDCPTACRLTFTSPLHRIYFLRKHYRGKQQTLRPDRGMAGLLVSILERMDPLVLQTLWPRCAGPAAGACLADGDLQGCCWPAAVRPLVRTRCRQGVMPCKPSATTL